MLRKRQFPEFAIVDGSQNPEVSTFVFQVKNLAARVFLTKKNCQAQCKCHNCDNRSQNPQKLSCRCAESRAKERKTGQTSCMDVTAKRRTKCPCYSSGRPCSIHCSCFNCENRYEIRVTQHRRL